MSFVLLSQSLQHTLNEAHRLALGHQHGQLDAIHLLHATIHTDFGLQWLHNIGCEDRNTFITALESEYSKRFGSVQGYADPTENYLACIRLAQKFSADAHEHEINAAYLVKAIFEVDTTLIDWLHEQGFQSADIVPTMATPLLDQLGRDLTSLASQGKLNPVIGREAETAQLIETLLRHGKNSALLLGVPGAGKTAVVEKLAQDIVNGTVPTKLRKIRLIEISTAELLAGTSYRGEFEERLKNLIDEITRAGNIILVIDEFHTLIGAGGSQQGSVDAINILKPALARGEITCIGITTHDEYRRFVEHDAALTRRFFPISIPEPSAEDTRKILDGVAPAFAHHHGVTIENEALEVIVKWTELYIPSRHFPDKAIDVLSKAASRAEIHGKSCVDTSLIADILSEITGMPLGNLDIDTRQNLVDLETRLEAMVTGQSDAIRTVSRAVRVAYAGLRDPQRPRGVFLFAGPSGVGKTQLARALAKILFDSEQALVRLDMSEYSEKYTLSRLIGAAPGYVGHDEPGQLTQPLRERPACVVLLDEVEKAHPEVFDLFLQLLGEGRLTDSHGNLADGRQAFFIMTTNLGAPTHSPLALGFDSRDALPNYEQAVRHFFRPEFVNRIDHIISFRHLDLDDLSEIVEMELRAFGTRLQEKNLRLTYEDSVVELLAQAAANSEAGARGVKRAMEDQIAVPISEKIIQDTLSDEHRWLHLQADGEDIRKEWM